MSGSRRARRGFSMLELVIAIAVISISLVTALEAFSYSTNIAKLSGELENALFFAEDKLQELESKEQKKRLTQSPLAGSDFSGKFQRSYSLSKIAEQDIYRLDLEVSWARSKGREKINAATYLK